VHTKHLFINSYCTIWTSYTTRFVLQTRYFRQWRQRYSRTAKTSVGTTLVGPPCRSLTQCLTYWYHATHKYSNIIETDKITLTQLANLRYRKNMKLPNSCLLPNTRDNSRYDKSTGYRQFPQKFLWMQDAFNTSWTIKSCHYIFDYKSRIYWSIFTLFAPVTTLFYDHGV